MSVSPVSSNDPYLAPMQSANQSQQDLTALGNALNAGDLTTAQNAFASFQTAAQNLGLGSTSASSTAQSGTNPNQDIQNLQSALSSGNLPAAKSAYTTLMTDLQSQKAHKHHHHHHGSDQSASASDSTTGSNSTGATADGTGSTVNVTA